MANSSPTLTCCMQRFKIQDKYRQKACNSCRAKTITGRKSKEMGGQAKSMQELRSQDQYRQEACTELGDGWRGQMPLREGLTRGGPCST